jgi:hypothetical protein
MDPVLREQLSDLSAVLARHGESKASAQVTAACISPEADMRAFLTSNELWGGSGSIADQSGVSSPAPARAQIEEALIQLGEAQIAAGVVNSRTNMWIEAFKRGQRRET